MNTFEPPEPDWSPGAGWREVEYDDACAEQVLVLHQVGKRSRSWVCEEPLPSLPTEPYTVIRVTWLNGWVCEPTESAPDDYRNGPSVDAEPLFDLRALPGWTQLADSIIAARTVPDWHWTPEGHDEQYEYATTADCDGSNVQHWRRTPTRRLTIPGGRQERIYTLPPASTRVSTYPDEEVRP